METRIIPITLAEVSLLRASNGPKPDYDAGSMTITGAFDLIALVRSMCAMRCLVANTCVVDGLLAKVQAAYDA